VPRVRLALLVAVAFLLCLAPPAAAHVELVESDPEADAVVADGVPQVEMRFGGLDPDRPVEIDITDPSGANVTDGDPVVDPRTSTVVVPTSPLQPGMHIVHWHAWSEDGDGIAEGTFTFTVREAARTGWGIWLVWLFALGIPAAIFLRPGARKRADTA
jgi:copper resistance protein C